MRDSTRRARNLGFLAICLTVFVTACGQQPTGPELPGLNAPGQDELADCRLETGRPQLNNSRGTCAK